MVALKRRDTLTKQLVDAISQRISSGHYKSGERLPTEQELIEEFAVSRTVVREAIANLKAVGMVSTQQGVGAFVLRGAAIVPFRLDASMLNLVNEAVNVMEVRLSLESEAAYLAAMRREQDHLVKMRCALDAMAVGFDAGLDAIDGDLAFHCAIAEATGNKHFLALFSYLGTLIIPRARLQTAPLTDLSRRAYFTMVHAEHEAIYEAIKHQDADGARSALRLHLDGSRERLAANGDYLKRTLCRAIQD